MSQAVKQEEEKEEKEYNQLQITPIAEVPDPKADREGLEKLIGLVQPGWRKGVVNEGFLPNMVVHRALVSASQSGIYGRPDVKVPDTENL